ncbi:protein ALP1-like [Zea mays]|uniref:protein ALP1-like n=1 Tax=Zea mays TaxID=4577 RepID=UPI0009AAD94E|nr:protein ALP1-like [Zea mays]|eukprot:XP_020396826.1 protein ALP1-like [Zea mays]
MFRMRRTVFRRLHDTLVQNYGLLPSRGVSTMEALGIFLWACGGPQSFRQIRNKFGHSLETISRKYSDVLNALYKMSSDTIKPKDPHFVEIHQRLREARFWPHFKDCIGAIDGSHFPAAVPASEQAKYIGRHGYTSQNVMAVCDFDMRFTFVVTGWPGSVHDTRVLQDTLLTYADRFPHPPEGKYYLVDSGYPNRKGYLAPYKGQKYHITEWQNARQPIGSKEVFNYAHSSLRNVIERSFGVLKMKWRILLSLPSFSLEKQSKIIIACMTLHNFIRDSALYDRDFDEVGPNSLSHDVPSGESSTSTSDELDMSAFRDAIANALVS